LGCSVRGLAFAAGLALAVRVSENPNTKVLVVEAGKHEPDHPGVQIPAMAGSTFKSEIDWVSRPPLAGLARVGVCSSPVTVLTAFAGRQNG